MEFLLDYLGFLARTATLVVAFIVVAGFLASLGARRHRRPPKGHIEVTRVNETLRDMRRAVEQAMSPPGEHRKRLKAEAKQEKREGRRRGRRRDDTPDAARRRRVFVLDFEGDIAATRVDGLRREITAVLGTGASEDEVVVRLKSEGGMVHGYGLAASQLARIRDRGMNLTVAVDRIAASGGYLMAVVANTILAAPFALVGSIGVMAQVPNVNRLLKKHDVDVELHTAGRYKRTLTVFGENTDEGREKFVEELNDIHVLFQEFVGRFRPDVDLDAVATGEAWVGQRALDRSLVDRLVTSDEYLAAACDDADVYEVRWTQPQTPVEKLMEQFGGGVDRVMDRLSGGLR